MRKLFTATALTLGALLVTPIATPLAAAEPTGQPTGAQAFANGPAKAWLVADLDTGQVLVS